MSEAIHYEALADSMDEMALQAEVPEATRDLSEAADALRQAAQEKANLDAVREWAERAAQGYDAENYNLTATPQESCGLAVLAVLKARIKETTDE